MKTTSFYLLLAIMTVIVACGPKNEPREKTQKVNSEVDVMPKYPGKNKALLKDIKSNAKYPEEALKKEISGKVYVSLVVNTSGKIVNLAIARGVDPILDKEALGAVNKLTKNWKPAQKDGKAVEATIYVLFDFKEDATFEVTIPEPEK